MVVCGAAALVLAVTQVRWVLRTPRHEILTSGRFGFVLALVGLVLFVLVLNGTSSAIKKPYVNRPLPAIPAYPAARPGAGPRRRVVRRWSGYAYFWMVIVAGVPVAVGIHWNTNPAAANVAAVTVGTALIAGCWLLGPAARFVVTPEFLHIDTGFRRTSVPRMMLAGFHPGAQQVRIELTDGGHRDFRVDTPLLDARSSDLRNNLRCQFRTVEGIVRALGEVPPVGTTYPVVATRDRSGPVAVAVGAVLVAAVVATLLA